MHVIRSNGQASYGPFLAGAGLLLILLCFAPVVNAQQPAATISSFSGSVLVSIQGKAPVAATVGVVLQAGDILQTEAGAQVALKLSEGSELQLGQNTKIDIAALSQRPKTGARQSRLKLWYGQLRAFLSPGHQKEGSSFEVETPNAFAGVKFSQPEIEVRYDPKTRTTIIIGYTVDINVINLLTRERARMAKAHQAIVRDEFLWITPIAPGVKDIPPAEQQRQTRIRLLLQSQRIIDGTVSPVPVSAGGRAETSQSPGPGGASAGPRPRTVIIDTGEE